MAAYITQKKENKLFIYNYVIVSGSGCTGNLNAKPDIWITRIKLVPGLPEFESILYFLEFKWKPINKSFKLQWFQLHSTPWSPHTHTHTNCHLYITSSMGTVIEVTHIINALFSTTTLIRAGYHLWLRYCQFRRGTLSPKRKTSTYINDTSWWTWTSTS